MEDVELIDITLENIDVHGLGCLKNMKHPGFGRKKKWIENQLGSGFGMKILKKENKTIGFVEYIDGEFAWRGVKAAGYLFIHCIWVYKKENLLKGYGSHLVEASIQEAEQSGKHGVAVLCSDGSWIADKRVFLKNGFKKVDEYGKFELLVKNFGNHPQPTIIKQKNMTHNGLKLTFAMQCPFFAKNVTEIQEVAKQENVSLEVKEITSPREAQNALSSYGVFTLTNNGRLLADYYTSKARFNNILK
ncbi:GNAT family N-acetyltransferase [Bacteroidota bacterium]